MYVSLLSVPEDARIQLESSSLGPGRDVLKSPVILSTDDVEKGFITDDVICTVDNLNMENQSPEDTLDVTDSPAVPLHKI
jgi:hypothetical protein